MQNQPNDQFVITRDTRGETVNGKPRPARVYITGPHFGTDIFSSTDDPKEASRYTRAEAERLVSKWRHHTPQIEGVS
jgi:hypothetical protein